MPGVPHQSEGNEALEAIQTVLREASFKGLRMMPLGSNAVFDALLEGPQGDIRAVYKPRLGEAPLWDFLNGSLYLREYAAFLVSHAAGWDFVPPTVVRDGPHGPGMVQLYVDHDPQITFFSLRDTRLADFASVAAYDAVTNNADRKGSHVLLGKDRRLWFIDHGLTFHTQYKLRTVIWEFQGEPMPPDVVDGLKAVALGMQSVGDLRAQLRELLDPGELAAFHDRLESVLEDPVFPWPGLQRSVPWPPV